MWTLHTTNAEHWVPIKTVSSFKRMREFQSLGKEWILDALKASKEVELDEKEENIRRITEVKEPKGQFERSIYAVSVFILKKKKSNHVYGPLERIRERRAWSSTKVRKVLQHFRSFQCCPNASQQRY